MGYESRVYLVHKTALTGTGTDMVYAQKLAEVDLSKCYPWSNALRDADRTNCYIYASDGDTEITEDRYGEPLKEISLHSALELVERILEKDDYWRLRILYAILKEMADVASPFADSITVLHYGY